MEASDVAAVALARTGDSEAFRLLVERYSRGIFHLAYRMTGNEQDAEDVVQETFLRAYGGLRRFESRARFGTWLYRIAVNCSMDLVRARQRREANSVPMVADRSEEVFALAASDPGPDRLVFSSEVQRRVTAALGRLGAMERAAFVLRHFEGMSIGEISRTLGVRASATKNNIFRAVQKLRRALEPLVNSAK